MVTGCDAGISLTVDLRTDLVPGAEFVRAEAITEGAPTVTRDVPPGSVDLVDGVRLATLEGLAPHDARRVTLRLLGAGGELVAERDVLVRHRSDSVITVVITRGCRGVVCDEGTCVDGECRDPRCLTGTEPECGGVRCDGDADCEVPTASCASARCETGICYQLGTSCAEDHYCSPDRGCQPTPTPCDDGGCADEGWVSVFSARTFMLLDLSARDAGPVLVGSFRGQWRHEGVLLGEHDSDERGAAVQLTPDGELAWSTTITGPPFSQLWGAEALDGGGAWVFGMLNGVTDVAGAPHDAGSRQEPLLLRVGPDGAVAESAFYPASGANAQGRGLGATGGRVAVAGLYGRELAVGDVTLPTAPDDDGWVALLDGPDRAVFAHSIAGGPNTAMNSAAVSGEGACFAGRVNGELRFPGGEASLSGSTQGFVVCFDGAGAHRWHARLAAETSNATVGDLHALPDGGLIAAGYFQRSLLSGGVTLATGDGEQDTWVARFLPDGEIAWVSTATGPELVHPSDLALTGRGTVVVGGVARAPGTVFGHPTPAGGWIAELDLETGDAHATWTYPSEDGFAVRGLAWDESRGQLYAAGVASAPIVIAGVSVTPDPLAVVVWEVKGGGL
ncbi:MAG TPA: hypothetical protein DEF51_14940 [Myxococcales bacterium]|nr:hypothetical protein [Myxococcales bacterium]